MLARSKQSIVFCDQRLNYVAVDVQGLSREEFDQITLCSTERHMKNVYGSFWTKYIERDGLCVTFYTTEVPVASLVCNQAAEEVAP